jgi:hypothetical protein
MNLRAGPALCLRSRSRLLYLGSPGTCPPHASADTTHSTEASGPRTTGPQVSFCGVRRATAPLHRVYKYRPDLGLITNRGEPGDSSAPSWWCRRRPMGYWWDRVVLPLRRVWLGVASRFGARQTGKHVVRTSRAARGLTPAGVACFLCRAVEAAAGGEHVRVRGRARDVGDAEPDDGGAEARAQATQTAPTLPRVLDRGRHSSSASRRCGMRTCTSSSPSFF